MCLVAAVWVCFAIWRASRAVAVAERDVVAAGRFPFTLKDLHPVASGVEQISAPAQFHTGVVFKNRLYAAGPAGLFTEGAEYRVGALLASCAPYRYLCGGYIARRRT